MNCQSDRLSSGLRRVLVGGPKAGEMVSWGSEGSRRGKWRVRRVEVREGRRVRREGTEVVGEKLLRRMVAWVMKILVYISNSDFGVLAGRWIMMMRNAIAHVAAGNIISNRSFG